MLCNRTFRDDGDALHWLSPMQQPPAPHSNWTLQVTVASGIENQSPHGIFILFLPLTGPRGPDPAFPGYGNCSEKHKILRETGALGNPPHPMPHFQDGGSEGQRTLLLF